MAPGLEGLSVSTTWSVLIRWVCCSLQGFRTHQASIPVFIREQQGTQQHDWGKESMIGSFYRKSEQQHHMAQQFSSPGNGEVVYKVTHSHFDLETSRHILTKMVKFSWALPGQVPPCPLNSVYEPGKWTHAFCTDVKGGCVGGNRQVKPPSIQTAAAWSPAPDKQ